MQVLEDFDVAGKRVFLRCDLNVPLKDGVITDDGRIRASLPTIRLLLEKGASLVIAAHLGRPKGVVEAKLSLAPIAKRLGELLAQEIFFSGDHTGDAIISIAHSLKTGEILLLENIRFSPAETSKDDAQRAEFATQLAQLADVYVGDGFGLVPAALIGIDVSVLLDSASATKKRFLKDPQLVVDIAYAVAFLSTQYVNLCDDESAMPGLSDRIEQLIAESTGKDGVGKLPVVIETIDKSTGFSVAFCGSADLVVSADLASQFIIWEWVTALVCAALSIDPFNQPNVTEAKEVTAALLTRWAGTVPVFTPDACDENIEIFGDGQSIKEALTLLIQSIPRDGYISVMAYLDRRDDANISQIRALLSSKSARPVTFGWGPRLLHSTGQFHKGGTRNGAFLAITGEVEKEISIEGQSYGFKTLLTAQAMGDGQALHSRKYPLLRLHLNNRAVGIEKLISALKSL